MRARANAGPSTRRTRASSSARWFSHRATGLDACSLWIAPPETAGLLGVPAFGGDDSEPGSGEHDAATIAEPQREAERGEGVTFGGIKVPVLLLELGGTVELSAFPPCPIDLVGDGGALERELDRAREIALSVGLLREVSEYLRLAARQAELLEGDE